MTDWENCYLENNTPWNRGAPSPPLAEWVRRTKPAGRAFVPGCGVGHDVAMLAESGMDVLGLDISATAIERARAAYPAHAARFIVGDLFALPYHLLDAFDWVIEHTCLSGMPPDWRPKYRDAVASALKPGGMLAGVWYVNPDMDPGESGPPFGISVAELDALFAGWQIIEDYIPAVAYNEREGRERVRVLRCPV